MVITAVQFKRSENSQWETGVYIEHDAKQILDSNARVVEDYSSYKIDAIKLSLNLSYLFKDEYERF